VRRGAEALKVRRRSLDNERHRAIGDAVRTADLATASFDSLTPDEVH
jgi:hypothetical protein